MKSGLIEGMKTSDFLKREVQTPLCEAFLIAGAAAEIRTNSEAILRVARECFPLLKRRPSVCELHFRLWVDPDGTSQPPWPLPYFRGLGPIVFGGFDSESSVLVNLTSRRVSGRFSPALAADSKYWKRVIFPRIITAVGPAIGVTELHCACLAWNGSGLVLFGGPGAGKSTLTLALARQGFSLLSEDWTYFSRHGGDLGAWGIPSGVKLLPDAVRHFPELSRFQTSVGLNGEEAYQTQPERDFGVSLAQSCCPKWLVFLDRDQRAEFNISAMSSAQAEEILCRDLLAQTPKVRSFQKRIVNRLVKDGCWRLRYGGKPQDVASALACFCLSESELLAETAAD
jgi:hypothetical protein